MVRPGNFLVVDRDVALGPQLVDQLLHRVRGDHRISGTLNDDARSGAGREEAEIVHVGRRRNRDETPDFRTPHQQLHPDQRAKAVAGHPGGASLWVDRLDPIKRGRGIGQFADPVVKAALAAADAAKVEPQRCKPAGLKGLVHRLSDPVVHRAAGLRVRMKDHRDRCARAAGRLKTPFETAFGSGKDHCGHGL